MHRPPGFERTPAYRLAKRTTPWRLAKDAKVDAAWRRWWRWEFGGGRQRFQARMEAALGPLVEFLTQRSPELRLFDMKKLRQP